MPHEAPAALPLFAYAAGLTFGVSLVSPPAAAAGFAAVAVLLLARPRRDVRRFVWPLLGLAAGVAMAIHVSAIAHHESASFAAFDRGRFVHVEAPLEHDWSPRGRSWAMTTSSFDANGSAFSRPLMIYARFDPPSIANESRISVEGFLRRNERGAYTLSVKSARLLAYRGQLSPASPRRWNRALARRIEPLAREHPVEVALAEAVALGRNERLTDEVRASFRGGGTYHLLVFSGLQIAAAAAFLAFLLRWLHAPRLSDWLLLLFAFAAPPFIGPTASVSRAAIGVGIYALTRILGRPTSLENLWCVAALVRLVAAPQDLGDVAFQLTYAGAGALLFLARRRAWLVPVVAELAIAPLTLFHFHQYALGGSLATLAMTPLIFAMLVAAAATFAFPAAIHAITWLHAACSLLNDVGAHTSGFHAAPSLASMVLGYGGALGALALLRGDRRRAAMAAALLIPLAVALAPRKHPDAEVVALDVGQGDSILLRGDDHAILVDGGGQNDATRFGETVLLPLLAERGIARLDAVFLTHAHPDHCGGLPAVLEHLEVGALWISPRRFRGDCATSILEAARRARVPIHLVRDGDRLPLGPIHATVLLAPGAFRRAAENNCSVVLRVQLGRTRVLATGDIERDAEARLSGRFLRCDVLKVAHHGSRSSTTAAFLGEVRPRLALISAGTQNLFGHPHREVVDALSMRGIRVLRTDRQGTVSIVAAGRTLVATPQIDTPE